MKEKPKKEKIKKNKVKKDVFVGIRISQELASMINNSLGYDQTFSQKIRDVLVKEFIKK